MLTEGLITEINYTSNVCKIRVPIFENISSTDYAILNGRICIQPGNFNSYKENDRVWVSFVDNKLNKPLIIGKIYQNPEIEAESSGGQLNISGLKVTGDRVELPQNIIFNGAKQKFKNLQDILNKLCELELKLKEQQQQINELKSK